MDKCEHIWLYIGSKRQKVWRCTRCDEYRLDDPKQKREWQGLTDKDIDEIARDDCFLFIDLVRSIEAKLREKNT